MHAPNIVYSKEEDALVEAYDPETGVLKLQTPIKFGGKYGRAEPFIKENTDIRVNVYRMVKTFNEDLLNAFIGDTENTATLDDDEVAKLYKKVLA